MVTAAVEELLYHTWASSRRPDENSIMVALRDQEILVSYYLHVDQDEDSNGEVILKSADFIEALRELRQSDQVTKFLPGVAPKTYITLTRQGADVDILCYWEPRGGFALVPLHKVLAVLARLAG